MMYMCTCVYVYVFIVCMSICARPYVRVYMCMSMCVCVPIYACVCVRAHARASRRLWAWGETPKRTYVHSSFHVAAKSRAPSMLVLGASSACRPGLPVRGFEKLAENCLKLAFLIKTRWERLQQEKSGVPIVVLASPALA